MKGFSIFSARQGTGLDDNDAHAIGTELERIRVGRGGTFQVDDVWMEAKKPKSPMHGYYEWDIQIAAEEHWRDRTRYLQRSIEVEIVNPERPDEKPIRVRAFEKSMEVPAKFQGAAKWTSTAAMLTSRSDKRRNGYVDGMITRLARELSKWDHILKNIKELSGTRKALRAVRRKLDD